MRDERIKVLEELLQDNVREKVTLDNKIQRNLNRIEEIDSYLASIKNSEETDFKVFSPRTAESLNKEKIADVTEEKELLNNSNNSYYKEADKIERTIQKLSFLIKEYKKADKDKHLAVLNIQEEEQTRIARELHDSSLQNLTHLVHSIELGSLFIDQDPVRAKLELMACSENLKKIIDEIRETIFNLRPMSFDDLGFKQCIDNLIDNIKNQYSSFTITYEVENFYEKVSTDENSEVISLFLVTVYRVIHEALLNAVKHSGGDKLELSVKKKQEDLVIKVTDNGNGFSQEEKDKHFGLSIMKERIFLLGGELEIVSEQEKGTEITIIVPLFMGKLDLEE